MKLQEKQDQERKSLFDKYGVFFAFSQERYNARALRCVKYKSRGAGMIMPTIFCKDFDIEWDSLISSQSQERVNFYGKEKIIRMAISNFECYYSDDITEAIAEVSQYGFTGADVVEVYNKNYSDYWAHN